MNNEIKEILDYMQQYVEQSNAPDYNGEYPQPWEITTEEVECILDLITNLQQDLDKANEIIIKDRQFNQNRLLDLAKLKEENERLKKDVEFFKSNLISSTNIVLSLITKIDKAIEYINVNKHLSMFADCREPEEDWNYDLECNANDLLNIFKMEVIFNENLCSTR